MPTGGVSPTKESLAAWFSAGVTCVGLGSQLIGKPQDGIYNYDDIEWKTSEVVQILKSIRK